MEKVTITRNELRKVFNQVRDERIQAANKLDDHEFLNKVYKIVINSVKEDIERILFESED